MKNILRIFKYDLKKIHKIVTTVKLITINNKDTKKFGFLFLNNFAIKSSIILITP